ncbi:uncharacterized protein [Nicotiana sylvestris]|uniref:uncharacterized protein n=1 Tax=Nicotiana sylvestris TaxID=4096 RepID=UPI00388C9B4D
MTGKRKQAIYYLSKKFTSYEAKYTLLERTCCTLTWVAQKLRHYLLAYTTYLVTSLCHSHNNESQALADHLAENLVDDEYQPLSTYFPDKEHYPAMARLWFFYTNNISEYEACIMGMNMAIDQDVKELLIMGDSDLIIRQAQGEWETRDVKLIP